MSDSSPSPSSAPPLLPEADVVDAAPRPLARVLVDVAPAHLDRLFDYLIPAELADQVRPGVRVKVPFAGRDVSGFVWEVASAPTEATPRRLAALRRLVSPEPVLAPQVARLSGLIAARYAGTRFDVLRLAVPPRHARTEARPSVEPPAVAADLAAASVQSARTAWQGYDGGDALLRRLHEGASPRAVVSVAPGDDPATLLAAAVAVAVAAGRGAIVCVPDARDAERFSAALDAALGSGQHVWLRADAGPAARYRDFLAVVRGTVRVVLGPRAAAWAPVHDLGLVAIWDDGDDLYAEPRAPYPHAREVLLLRAEAEGAAAVLAAYGRSVEADRLVRTGWARSIGVSREALRRRLTVAVTGEGDGRDAHAAAARLPKLAHDTIRWGLQHGPVLVQSPRAGYVPALACAQCRTPARCLACSGPLTLTDAAAPPSCRWCGTIRSEWRCGECGAAGLRAPVVGSRRTLEELGRIFAPAVVKASGAGQPIHEVSAEPAVVVATPGAEPLAAGGYAAVVLLDTWLTLARIDLRTGEEALRRWCNAAGLTRPGARVVVVGDPMVPPIQALVRWDAAGFAEREAAERAAARLPPAARIATITGSPTAVEEAAAFLRAGESKPPGLEFLGPMAVAGPAHGVAEGEPTSGPRAAGQGDDVRLLVRVPRRDGDRLSAALVALQRARAAAKAEHVRIQVDPSVL